MKMVKLDLLSNFSQKKEMYPDFLKITKNKMFLRAFDNHKPVLFVRDIISGKTKFYNAYFGAYSKGSDFKIFINSDNTQFYMLYKHCYDAVLTDMSIAKPKFQYYLLKLNSNAF